MSRFNNSLPVNQWHSRHNDLITKLLCPLEMVSRRLGLIFFLVIVCELSYSQKKNIVPVPAIKNNIPHPQIQYAADPNHRDIAKAAYARAVPIGFDEPPYLDVRSRLEAGAYSEDYDPLPGNADVYVAEPWETVNKFYGQDIPYGSLVDPQKKSGWFRGFSHGYYPQNDNNWAWPDAPVGTTIDWADASSYNNFTWPNAIQYYRNPAGGKDKAYVCLGHLIHLLTDLSIPAHVRVVNHGWSGWIDQGTQYVWDPDYIEIIADEYETAIAKSPLDITIPHIPALSQTFAQAVQMGSVSPLPTFTTWKKYFSALALFTDSTPLVDKYYKAPLENGEFGKYLDASHQIIEPEPISGWSLEVAPLGKVEDRWTRIAPLAVTIKGPNIPEQDLIGLCTTLVPQAVAYSTALILHFFKEANLSIISPSSNTSIIGGMSQPITWNVVPSLPNVIPNVRLEYSIDNGASWTLMIGKESVPNSGSTQWLVPNIASTKCKVRLCAIDDPAYVYCESKMPFTIRSLGTDFSANVVQGIAPLTVQFTNLSSAPSGSTYEWDFKNDGTATSTAVHPSYTYVEPGIYSVKLTMYGGDSPIPDLKQQFITVFADLAGTTKLAAAEYFIDDDPGVGKAININVATVSDYQIDAKLNISTIQKGIHILGFRVQDRTGLWSHTFNKLFINEINVGSQEKEITDIEYFIDLDPGPGNGNKINTALNSELTLYPTIDVASLPNGIHILMMRIKDTNGKWSMLFNKIFIKSAYSPNRILNIKNAEYFFDQDPGYGHGYPIPITQAVTIDALYNCDLTTASNGLHVLYVRVQDSQNNWSYVHSRSFIKDVYVGPPNLSRIEYFIDSDPGLGNGHSIGGGLSNSDSISVTADLSNIAPGIHVFFCRAQDTDNRWSNLFSKIFITEIAEKSTLLTEVEYFFDVDPGMGKGNKIAVSPAGELDVEFDADLTMLDEGKHHLFIRVKDNTGVWSWLEGSDFEKLANIISMQLKMKSGWNLVSLPILTENMSVASIFPAASSKLFHYDNGYGESASFSQGKGYWLKFDQRDTVTVSGQTFPDDHIPLKQGWNLIGGMEKNIPFANLHTHPANIIQSMYFGYNAGYVIADTMKPGNAYWVKSNENGSIDSSSESGSHALLAKASPLNEEGSVNLTVADKQNNVMNLYLSEKSLDLPIYGLPPLPPAGIFDVRWKTDTFVDRLSSEEKSLVINSAEYPITINVSGKDIRFKDGYGGRLLNALVKNGKSITISNPSIQHLTLTVLEIPTRYELSQNYPNPFNPATTIRFGLPEKTQMNLSVYNILGQKVVELLDGVQDAGNYQLDWNAGRYSSGVYIYRLQTPHFNSAKKMLFTK